MPDLYIETADAMGGKSVGLLTGLDPSSVKITEGYYTDTRIQASFTTYGSDGFDGYDRLRIVYNGTPLMTGFVTERKDGCESGTPTHDYTIDSALYGLSVDMIDCQWSFGHTGSSLRAADIILKQNGYPYYKNNARNGAVATTKIFEIGTTYLSMLYEVTNNVNRIDVDGNGFIVLRSYVAPQRQTSTKTLALDDVVGDVSTTSDAYKTPAKVIAKGGAGDNVMVSVAWANPDWESHWSKRGYTVAKTVDVTEDNPSYNLVRARAQSELKDAQDKGIEHQCNVKLGDWHQGQVITFDMQDRRAKCLVKTVETDFSTFLQQLTLKEV